MKMFILLDIGGLFQAVRRCRTCASLYPIKPPKDQMRNKKPAAAWLAGFLSSLADPVFTIAGAGFEPATFRL